MMAILGDAYAPTSVLSGCGRYRYVLRVPLGSSLKKVLFVLANPSTAVVVDGVLKTDRTITRLIGYAAAWGFGEVLVANARAWRATNPENVPEDPLAIGPDNDGWLRVLAKEAELVVCGWGKLGAGRAAPVLELLRQADRVPHVLALNADGSPKHPLYLAKDLRPFPMTGEKT